MQLKAPDIAEPHRESQGTQQPLDEVMPREAVREEARQVVEDRVARRLESDEAPFTRLRSARRERPQAVVLPQDVGTPLDAVSDPQPAPTRETDELPVTEQRAEHHLELHRVRRDPTHSDLGM